VHPYILVESLAKSFGHHKVLSDLTFGIKKEEIVAIMGPSGCGKSTLLNILGLLESPDSGAIYLAGDLYPKINSKKAMLLRRNEINYLFQSFALIDSKSVRENLLLSLTYTKLDKSGKTTRIRKMLAKFGLEDKLNSTVNELSGGEKQRVAISRAILKPGNLILADEPTGSLDKKMAHTVMDSLILATRTFHKTLVVVSHDMEMAAKCDRILSLSYGRLG
jgi:putative ABC transport system ATP-binding protein